MNAAAKWVARRIAAGLLMLAALFAVMTLAPIRIYKPSCGEAPRSIFGNPPRIDGPLRPEYVELLTRAMREEGFRYWRVRHTVLVPLLPMFDGTGRWGWTDFVTNNEWRIASSIVNGYTALGCAPPPEGVRRLYGDVRATCGVPRERRSDGSGVYLDAFSIRNDCNLFRAAVIRTEDMPEPLPALERPVSLRDTRPAPPASQRW